MIKSKTFLLLTLSLPYLCCAVISALPITNAIPNDDLKSSNLVFDFLRFVFSTFVSGVWFWGIPYSFLTIYLLVWSTHRSSESIYRAVFYAPLVLIVLMVVELAIVVLVLDLILSGTGSIWESFSDVLSITSMISVTAIIVTLLYGYLFVSIGLLLHKALEKLGFIETNGERMPTVLRMITEPIDQIRQKLIRPR